MLRVSASIYRDAVRALSSTLVHRKRYLSLSVKRAFASELSKRVRPARQVRGADFIKAGDSGDETVYIQICCPG